MQNLGADKQTVLLLGGGALADALQQQLGNQEVVVEHAARGQEAATARALAPDLIVLVGDAAQDRGAGVIAHLPECPVLVVCSAEPEPAPNHIGFLAADDDVSECVRRVQVVVELFMELGLGSCSLQQLTDTAAPRPKPKPAAAVAAPVVAPTKPPTTPRASVSTSATANRSAPAPRSTAAFPSRKPPVQAQQPPSAASAGAQSHQPLKPERRAAPAATVAQSPEPPTALE
ncbi:MAG TPA: hypothetical protein VJV78_39335, partial [Polyangiales bacterium]|nr:hypothetical protein [Polyangiales bacterium]